MNGCYPHFGITRTPSGDRTPQLADSPVHWLISKGHVLVNQLTADIRCYRFQRLDLLGGH